MRSKWRISLVFLAAFWLLCTSFSSLPHQIVNSTPTPGITYCVPLPTDTPAPTPIGGSLMDEGSTGVTGGATLMPLYTPTITLTPTATLGGIAGFVVHTGEDMAPYFINLWPLLCLGIPLLYVLSNLAFGLFKKGGQKESPGMGTGVRKPVNTVFRRLMNMLKTDRHVLVVPDWVRRIDSERDIKELLAPEEDGGMVDTVLIGLGPAGRETLNQVAGFIKSRFGAQWPGRVRLLQIDVETVPDSASAAAAKASR